MEGAGMQLSGACARAVVLAALLGSASLGSTASGLAHPMDDTEGMGGPAETPTATAATSPPAPAPATSPPSATARSAPVGAVPLRPGDNAQAAVDAHPEGTAFVLTSGVHHGFSVKPRSGQSFHAEPGAVLDGGGRVASAFYAFRSPDDAPPNKVSIQGAGKTEPLVVRNYSSAPREQVGAIHCHVDTRPRLGLADGWTLQWLEVKDNWSTGIRACNNMMVRENSIHHNGQLGIGGSWAHAVVVEGNEIWANKTRPEVDPNWEAGGAKFALTNGLVVLNNYVHDNQATGLWTDIEAWNTNYEGNVVVNNAGAGIQHEISHAARIVSNTVVGNGWSYHEWLWGAGIVVAASDNVEVTGNLVRGNANGIAGIQQNRVNRSSVPYLLTDLWVHDNTIDASGGSGVVQDDNDRGVWSRNRFERNTYRNGSWFTWEGSFRPGE